MAMPLHIESDSAKNAKNFLKLLTPEQRAKAVYALDSDQLFNWHFVPRSRPGIPWSALEIRQKAAGQELLTKTLSKAGYEKIEVIRSLEAVLFELENGNAGRDSTNYSFVFFGEPSDSKPWAWRYEGHHLSLTFVYRDGQLVSSSPQFLGSNPAEVRSGPRKGTRTLAKEQDLAFKLLNSLAPEQTKLAIQDTKTRGDIFTGNSRKAAIEGRKGLAFEAMNPVQRATFLELVSVHAEVQSEREQARRIKQIKVEKKEDLVFAWMGSLKPGAPHYYRIQGKDILIEYDNSQGNGNHIHAVWRNLSEDFGGDVLGEHLTHHHHR